MYLTMFAVQYMFTFKNSVLNLCQKMETELRHKDMFNSFNLFDAIL